jgi:hypothetical protein
MLYTTQQFKLYIKIFRELEPHSGKVYSIQLYVIKIVSDLRQVCGFLRVLRFPPPIIWTTMI